MKKHLIATFIIVSIFLLSRLAFAPDEDTKPNAEASKPRRGELLRAVALSDTQATRSLLDCGANINENLGTEDAPLTPLFTAIAIGDEAIIRLLFSHENVDLHRRYNGWSALDFAILLNQDALASRLPFTMAANEPQDEQTTLDVDRTTYVANGLASLSRNRDHGTALGLSYIVASYHNLSAGMIDSDEILKTANRLRDEYASQEQYDHPNLERVANVAFNILEDKRMAQSIVQGIVDDSSFGTSLSTLPDNLENPLRHGHGTNRFYVRVLEDAYLLGQSDSQSAGEVVNAFAGTTLNAAVADSSETLIQRNVNNFHPAVVKLIRADTRAEQFIYTSWTEVFADIKSANDASIEVLNRIDGAQLYAAEEFERNQTIAALESSVYVLKTFASFENPKLAHQIATVGGAGIQIGKAVDTFLATGVATLASSVTLVGGVVSGIMMLVSVVDSGPTTEQIILDQVIELRQQVEDVRQQMHERFDLVDRRLDRIFQLSIHGLQSVSIDLALAKQEIRSVMVQLSILERPLFDLEPNFRKYLRDGFDRELWRKVGRCLDWQHHQKGRLPYEKFADALDALRIAATREAKDYVESGRQLRDRELQNDSQLAASFIALSDDGLDCIIGLLQSIALHFGHDGVFTRARLANPLRWAMMVDAYAQLASQYPDYFYKHTSVAGVEEMLQIGHEWEEAIRSLNPASTEASQESAGLYFRLLENYKNKVAEFRSVVREFQLKYQLDHLEGYDPCAGPHQPPRSGLKRPAFGMPELRLSEEVDLEKANQYGVEMKYWRGQPILSAPAELVNFKEALKVLPPELIVAHHLGRGQITVWWADLGGDDDRRQRQSASEDFIFVKPALTLTARFELNGQTYPLFERRLIGLEEFHYGYQTFNTRIVSRGYRDDPAPTIYERTTPNWGRCNLMIELGERLLIQEQVQRQWPKMRSFAFQGFDRDSVPEASVMAATEAVDAYFKEHREILEMQLWAGIRGGDAGLVDAIRQLTAAKAMLDAFVSLGMSKSLSENTDFRDLFCGEKLTKGETRLFDFGLLETIAANGVALLEVTRDAEWLDGPPNNLAALFKNMQDSDEPQQLIEATLERLKLLKKMHEAVQPKQTLSQAAQELRKNVETLSHRYDQLISEETP